MNSFQTELERLRDHLQTRGFVARRVIGCKKGGKESEILSILFFFLFWPHRKLAWSQTLH